MSLIFRISIIRESSALGGPQALEDVLIKHNEQQIFHVLLRAMKIMQRASSQLIPQSNKIRFLSLVEPSHGLLSRFRYLIRVTVREPYKEQFKV